MLNVVRSGPRAVVVTDGDALRLLIAATLSDAGFDVLTARDGPEALKLLARREIDLAVVASRLAGGFGGRETVRRARGIQPGLKALFVTEGYGETAACGDLDAMVVRPLDERKLLGQVYELLLRDESSESDPRCRQAAEFGIAAARRSCLESGPVAA